MHLLISTIPMRIWGPEEKLVSNFKKFPRGAQIFKFALSKIFACYGPEKHLMFVKKAKKIGFRTKTACGIKCGRIRSN